MHSVLAILSWELTLGSAAETVLRFGRVLSGFPVVFLLNVKEFPLSSPDLFTSYTAAISSSFSLCSSLASLYHAIVNMLARRGSAHQKDVGFWAFVPHRPIISGLFMPLKAEALYIGHCSIENSSQSIKRSADKDSHCLALASFHLFFAVFEYDLNLIPILTSKEPPMAIL